MKNKILRLLSLFLVICTVASVVVLPASAEDMKSIPGGEKIGRILHFR